MGKKTLDDDVGAICNAEVVEENWTAIMSFCDRMASSEVAECSEATRAIAKRLGNKNPRTINFAITLTNACVENGGRNFRLALASRDFMAAVRQLLDPKNASKVDSKVRRRLAGLMMTWQKEFGNDPQLVLVKSTIQDLRQLGVEFDESNASTGLSTDAKPPAAISSAGGVSSASTQSAAALRKQEEEDLKKAIEASLREVSPATTSSSQRGTTSNSHQPAAISSPSLYPSLAPQERQPQQPQQAQPPPAKQARVLYDFDAGEQNELTLRAGEVVRVLDDSDTNWWKGESGTGHQGFFPAAFVTFDLYARPPQAAPQPAQTPQPAQVVQPQPALNLPQERLPQQQQLQHSTLNSQLINGVTDDPAESSLDPAKFDRLLELLQAEVSGDDSRRQEREALEEVCRASLPQVQERIDLVDNRLARVTKMMEKYSLVMTLCNRLLVQPPARIVQQRAAAVPRPGSGLVMGQPGGVPPPLGFAPQGYPQPAVAYQPQPGVAPSAVPQPMAQPGPQPPPGVPTSMPPSVPTGYAPPTQPPPMAAPGNVMYAPGPPPAGVTSPPPQPQGPPQQYAPPEAYAAYTPQPGITSPPPSSLNPDAQRAATMSPPQQPVMYQPAGAPGYQLPQGQYQTTQYQPAVPTTQYQPSQPQYQPAVPTTQYQPAQPQYQPAVPTTQYQPAQPQYQPQPPQPPQQPQQPQQPQYQPQPPQPQYQQPGPPPQPQPQPQYQAYPQQPQYTYQ